MRKEKMNIFKLKKNNPEQVIVQKCYLATHPIDKFFGLMGEDTLFSEEGLLIEKCNSIHMWFMKCALDILFLKKIDQKSWQVLSIHENVKPWKMLPLSHLKADDTLEVNTGFINKNGIQHGDLLCTE